MLKVVEDTWVWCLQDPDSLYTRVAPRDLLDLLATHSGGIERAYIVVMFSIMHLWWAEYPRDPKFINIFNDAQKNSTRASMAITDNFLAAMDTSALLSANSFPNDRPS